VLLQHVGIVGANRCVVLDDRYGACHGRGLYPGRQAPACLATGLPLLIGALPACVIRMPQSGASMAGMENHRKFIRDFAFIVAAAFGVGGAVSLVAGAIVALAVAAGG